MNRNIEKLIAEYDRKIKAPGNYRFDFSFSDINTIKRLSEHESISTIEALYNCITNGLKVGFMAGYNCRKTEQHRTTKTE